MSDLVGGLAGFCVFVLWYVYLGYLFMLRLMVLFHEKQTPQNSSFLMKVSVLLTVHNEELNIVERINNLLNQDYPNDLIEVIVASDGSTDATNRLVSSFVDDRVRLFVAEGGLGKTATQNAAIKLAVGPVVIFTDAGSRFEPDFIRRIVAVFSDPSVGAADGHLLFTSDNDNQIAQSQGFYWRYELSLREAESRLGILAVASGACLAVRKQVFRRMDLSIGEDCIVPLDVVTQGLRVVHVPEAIAYDAMENDPEREFRTRVRMTLRNWQGTWSRPQLLNPYKYPGYAFALWSHKLFRWLSPFFLVALTLCVALGVIARSNVMIIALGILVVFYVMALLGWVVEKRGLRIPVVQFIYSFMLANVGFMVGVTKALLGQKIYKYR